MGIRTDLAIDKKPTFDKQERGIIKKEKNSKFTTVCEIEFLEQKVAEKYGKEKGKYITISFESLEKISDYREIEKEIERALSLLCKKDFEQVLVIALGNEEITADNIGPKTAKRLLATRHIAGEFAEKIGLKKLKSVSILSPNVLGKTGIETAEICTALCKKINPDFVIVLDALCTSDYKRIFKTVQLTNSGISPGSGVKNKRQEISQKTLGIPVIAVGVPTVTTAEALAFYMTEKPPKEDCELIVTPKDCDLYSHRITEILSNSLNRFLQPEIDEEIIFELV